jgi:prepilin-type N-terminal cleavage/methylation domain-containing protein
VNATASSGYTLTEILVAVGLIGILSAISLPAVGNALTDSRANATARIVLGQLQSASELAQKVRRNIEIKFIGTNQLQVIRIDGTTSTVINTVTFEGAMAYRLFTGVPDTPDGFGNATPTYFGAATRLFFTTDGSLVDQMNLPISGTIFLGMLNKSLSARAITLLGTTGRAQIYRWDGRQWQY